MHVDAFYIITTYSYVQLYITITTTVIDGATGI